MNTDEAAPESFRPHHFLSSSPNNVINLAEYTFQRQGDPAFKVRTGILIRRPCRHRLLTFWSFLGFHPKA